MNDFEKYNINTNIKYNHLELVNVPEIVENCTEKWFNQTLTEVNDSLVRLGIFEGEFHWHKHDNDDEFFYVIEGKLTIETEKGNFHLEKNQGVTIPKGIMHRPVSPEKSVVLMIETNKIVPTGD